MARCLIYDRWGFGRSQPADPLDSLDLGEHLDDAIALIDVLAAQPVIVIGRSTGGQIALALAHHHPEKVRALVLLEPALFTADAEAQAWAWAWELRRQVLATADNDPALASEAVIRHALGAGTWDSFPAELQELLAAASPAVLAEMRGQGLDLSEQPLRLESDALAHIEQETLLVSSADSPAALRLVNDRLAMELPNPELAWCRAVT